MVTSRSVTLRFALLRSLPLSCDSPSTTPSRHMVLGFSMKYVYPVTVIQVLRSPLTLHPAVWFWHPAISRISRMNCNPPVPENTIAF